MELNENGIETANVFDGNYQLWFFIINTRTFHLEDIKFTEIFDVVSNKGDPFTIHFYLYDTNALPVELRYDGGEFKGDYERLYNIRGNLITQN